MSKTPPGPKELALQAMRAANLERYSVPVEKIYKRAVNVLKKSAAKRARKK